MNLNSVASLVNDNITTVVLSLMNDRGGNTYTFKAPLDVAKTLKEGDMMVARTKHGLVFGTVVEVHAIADINPDASFEYQWAFQKVDIAGLKALDEQEAVIVKKLTEQRRDTYRKKVLAALVEEGFDTKLLGTVTNATELTAEQPPAYLDAVQAEMEE